jgi:hypothetical protein
LSESNLMNLGRNHRIDVKDPIPHIQEEN